MATREATWRYRNRFGDAFGRTYFRRFGPGVASSVGIGTYLGAPTDAVDDAYREAIRLALGSGINVVDTAVNYRCGRAEHVVGDAIRSADVDRDAVFLATKGGFVPFDGERPDDPGEYVRETFIEPGRIDPTDLVRGSHCIAPGFLDAMLDRSLSALDVDAVDCYYVHNPETQLAERSREAVYDALEDAFTLLERRRLGGDIGGYGVATWDAFRVPEGDESSLALAEVIRRAERAAERVGADDHGFTTVQLPFNVRMADAFTRRTQPPAGDPGSDERVSTLECAHDAGVAVVTSASIGQGDLAAGDAMPSDVAATLAGDTPAQKALNFARSAPGVRCALVGASDAAHVRENVAAGTFDPLGADAFDAVFT